MKCKFQRLAAFLLVLLMLTVLFPAAYAAEADSGTIEGTFPAGVQETGSVTAESVPEPTEEGLAAVTSDEQPFPAAVTGTTITITEKNGFYIGYTEFDYHQYISGAYYPVGPYFTETAAYFSTANGGYAFCVQPSKHGEIGDYLEGEWNKYIDTEAMIGIGRALCYGAPNNGDTSVEGLQATTLLLWDIATGYRNADGTARTYNAHGERISPPFYKVAYGAVKTKYDDILDKMQNHSKIPSFAAPAEGLITDANTIMLNYNPATGLYEASVTDTNEILADYNYTSDISGLAFTRDGNTLKISATEAAALKVGSGKNFFTRGHYYEVTDKTALVWSNAADENSQQLTTLPAKVDPVPAYIRLALPTGSLSIAKTTEDGLNLSGWQFSLYSDEACTNLLSGPYSSDTDGKINIPDLAVGTVWVKELGHTDAAVNALYKCDSQNPQKVTLTPGQTAQVGFHNRLNSGQVKLVKTTNTGSNVSGWKIGLYYDAACTNPVSGSPFTTGADGSVTVSNLNPGTLYAKEEPVSDPYWLCDREIKEITIVSGAAAEVAFHNTHLGIIKIVKALDINGPLEGWIFKVTDSSGQEIPGSPLTSRSDGSICTDVLLPGQYTVEEISPKNSIYSCLSVNPQTVSVDPGETAEVVFINMVRPGTISVKKTDATGNALPGAKFLLEWSANGSVWEPVEYSADGPVSKGACTAAGLDKGMLTIPENGVATFTGLHPELYYRLTEVAASEGKQLSAAPVFEGMIPIDETLSVSVTVVNGDSYVLPLTGSTDMLCLLACWLLSMTVGTCSFMTLRRKER